MYISARERQILEILLSKLDGVTVKEVADHIDVSVRTIHRDIKGVEDILHEYGLKLIKKSRIGIQVEGSLESIKDLELFLFNLSHNEYTPEERQTVMFCTLLEATEPVKLISIANDLNVTIATVSNDLTKLEERLRKYGLSLIRKRGYGVEIFGSETAKRRAMSNILSENVNEFEFLTLVRENIQKKSHQTSSASERLLGLVEKKKLLVVEKVIEEINNELPYSIADSAYIGLVIHITLAIERIIQGENIQIEKGYMESLDTTIELKIAEKIVEKLEKLFSITIPAAEIGYITMHLRGAKLRHDKEYIIEDSNFNIAIRAKNLIDYVESIYKKDLASTHSLFQGLVAHLRPAIYRMKQNMGISNPLLAKIKKDYSELFEIVKKGTEQVFIDLHVPEEEVGYLVLHFGSALIGIKEKEEIKAIIICSTGIGTSKMLATRIQQEIPQLKDLKNISLFDLKKMDIDEYDLIISTIQSPNLPEATIFVSPILTLKEIELVKASIKRRTRKLIPEKENEVNVQINSNSLTKSLEKMQTFNAFSTIIVTLLEGFSVEEMNGPLSVEDAIRYACNLLYKEGSISNSQDVMDALFEREKLGGLGIPGTNIALYHTKSECVLKPSLKVIRLSSPISLLGMDTIEMNVMTILLLLAPEKAIKEHLEMMSYVSSLVIEDEKSIELFSKKDYLSLSSFLAKRFEQFFYEKINEK